jgi:hypothetical protein
MPHLPHLDDRKLRRIRKRLINSRFFTVSCLLHLVFVLTFGGTVLFNKYVEPPDFTGGEPGGFVSGDEVAQPPPQQQPLEQQPTFTVTSPSAQTSLEAITTSAPSQAAFSLPQIITPTIAPGMSTGMQPTSPNMSVTAPGLTKEIAAGIRDFSSGWTKKGDGGPGTSLKTREFQFTAYLAKYSGGNWNSTVTVRDGKITEGSLMNLLFVMCKLTRDKVKADPQPLPLDLSSNEIFSIKPPFIILTGHRDFVLTDLEVQNLQKYIRLGGCVWGDSSVPGRRSRFDLAFRREMRRVVPDADKDWEEIPANHPIFTKTYYPEIKEVPAGMNYYREPLWCLKIFGEIAILYTPNDYGDMWQFGLTEKWVFDTRADEHHNMVAMNDAMWHRRDLYFHNLDEKAVKATYMFGTNIVVHLLTRWEDKVRNVPKSL